MKIGIVGLGTMGAGIAQLAIEAGFDTIAARSTCPERRPLATDRALPRPQGREGPLDQLRATRRSRASPRLRHRRPRRVRARDRGGFEDLAAKLGVRRARGACSAEAILATNTSALSVGAIAAGLGNPAVVGMHFFNPAPLMPLVEIVRAERRAMTRRDRLRARRAPGTPADPLRRHAGFVVNRVLIPLLNDCVRVLDEAGVSPEDLDTALTLGAGWPLGPCALLDLVGIDVHVHASETLHEKLREPRLRRPRDSSGWRSRQARSQERRRLLRVRVRDRSSPAGGVGIGRPDGDVPGLPPDVACR